MPPRPSTSAETAARFLAMHAPRAARQRAFRQAIRRAQHARVDERRAFDAAVFAAIGRLTPRGPNAIRQVVEAEWGPICRSRLFRALHRLVAAGMIVRGEDGWLRARGAA